MQTVLYLRHLELHSFVFDQFESHLLMFINETPIFVDNKRAGNGVLM